MTESETEPEIALPAESRAFSMRNLQPADILLGAGLAAGWIGSYVLLGLTASMLRHHGVLLESLTGSIVSMVSAGAFARVGRDPLLLVILAPLAGIALYDVFYWWAGHRWGDAIVGFYTRNNPRMARMIGRTERLVRRRGVIALALAYYVPLPNVAVYLLCGVSQMPLVLFIVGDIIGTLLWEALLISLGWTIGQPVVSVVQRVSHDALWVTIGVIVAIVVISGIRNRPARA